MRRCMIAATMVVLAACTNGGQADTSTTSQPGTTEPTATTATTVTTTTSTTTTVPEDATTTSSATTGPDELPGERIELGPTGGDTLAVIGVRHDDVLNLRTIPDPDADILAEIPPLADDVTALGHTRDIGDAIWIAVEHDGVEGWVNFAYTGFLGQTTDETSALLDALGERPHAPTMEELGAIVAETFTSEPPQSDVVMTAPATTGDLGEVMYDVIGIGDDAVAGFRVHVFGEPDGDGFTLRTVEVTTLCGRGISEEGLCL